jgi:hypothetical protein
MKNLLHWKGNITIHSTQLVMAINYRLKNFRSLLVANQIVFYSISALYLPWMKLITEKWGCINMLLCVSFLFDSNSIWRILERDHSDISRWNWSKGYGNMENELLPRKLSTLIDIRKRLPPKRNGMKYVKQLRGL